MTKAGAEQAAALHRPRKRAWWAAAWVLACVVGVAGGFAASLVVTSPWEDAVANSETEPLVTSVAEYRDLVVEPARAEGTFSRGSEQALEVSGAEGQLPIVTATWGAVDEPLRPGAAVMAVSGRPVIPLVLPFSLYRDILPGDSGADFEALQRALEATGSDPGSVDGVYGPRTAQTIRELYQSNGVLPPAADPALVEAATAAEEAYQTLIKPPVVASVPTADGTGSGPTVVGPSKAEIDAARNKASQARQAADTPIRRTEILAVPENAVIASIAPVGTDLAAEGAPVALQVRTGHSSAIVRVAVADLGSFAVGAAVTVSPTNDASVTVTGVVTQVSDFRNADATNALPGRDAVVTFDAEADWEAGATVTARAGEGSTTNALAVPLIAIRQAEGRSVVRVPDPGFIDGYLEVPVTVVTTSEGYAFIEEGDLAAGATVIVAGA